MDNFVGSNKKVRIVQILFYVNALLWFYLSALTMFRGNYNLIIYSLIFAEALLSLILGIAIKFKKAWIYYLSLLFVIGNIILTIADQMGFYDYLILVIFIVTLIMLIVYKKYLINRKEKK